MHILPKYFLPVAVPKAATLPSPAAVRDLGCKHIITSPIEHHAVTHSVEHLDNMDVAKVSYVKLLPNGHVDIEDLEKLLAASEEKTLVTLMHANNEIGNILDIHAVGNCVNYIMPFFTAIPCKLLATFLSILEIHRYILLPALHINFTGQKAWAFYTSMKMYA